MKALCGLNAKASLSDGIETTATDKIATNVDLVTFILILKIGEFLLGSSIILFQELIYDKKCQVLIMKCVSIKSELLLKVRY